MKHDTLQDIFSGLSAMNNEPSRFKTLIKDDAKYPDIPVEGINGYYWLDGKDKICVPWIVSLDEGKGNFSKALKWLESFGRDVVFINIISGRIAEILAKKGYVRSGIATEEGPVCVMMKEMKNANNS